MGESAELAAEAERLEHADALQQAAALAHQLLEGDEDAGAATALGAAARAVHGPGGHDRALGELAERAQALAAEVGDLASSLRAYAESVLVDPARLEEINTRVALLRDLERKYGDDEAAVLAFAGQAAARLAELEGGTLRSEGLEAEAAELRRELAGTAAALTAARRDAAARLGEALRVELADLAMPSAQVVVAVEQDPDDDRPGGRRPPPGRQARTASTGSISSWPPTRGRPCDRSAGPPPGASCRGSCWPCGSCSPGSTAPRRWSSTRSTPGSAAAPPPPSAAAWPSSPAATRCWSSPTCPRSPPTPTGTSPSRRPRPTGPPAPSVRLLDDAGRVGELSRMLAGMEGSGLAQAHAEELLAAATAAKNGRDPGPATTVGPAAQGGERP